jgi:hypothetical protein
LDEASTAPGDSGGPAFIGGRIAGVSSFHLRLDTIDGETPDIDGIQNASFGEYNAFTRVSSYRQWIHAIPEPSTTLLCGAVALMLACHSLMRRRRPR